MSTSKIIIPIDIKRRQIAQFFSINDHGLLTLGLVFHKAILSDILNNKLDWYGYPKFGPNITVKDGEFIIDINSSDKFTIISGPKFKEYDVYFINEGEHIKIDGADHIKRYSSVSFEALSDTHEQIIPELLDHVRKFLTTKYPLEGQNG